MQITIDLPQDLEQDLIRQAAQSNIPTPNSDYSSLTPASPNDT